MINFLKTYFSPEKKAARLEKKLQKAISANNQQKVISVFCKAFMFLFRKKKAQLLSNLVISYCSKIADINLLEKKISSVHLKQAVSLLEENKLDSAALEICDHLEFDMEAIEILAKLGRANELAMHMTKDNIIDKEFITKTVISWEKYNGDIGKSPTLGDVLKNIAEFSLESIPDNPGVREIIGQFKEAAFLYVKEGDLGNAARCYEKAEMYLEASKTYEDIGDKEGVSRAAESLGDLEKALKFVIKPERKVKLLIRMERFFVAREFAAGLESPDEYFDLIKEKARKRMEVKIKSRDFIGAMELADVAGCEFSEREEILLLGRQYFNGRIASPASEEDIKSIYRDRVKLEEKAGHFEDAGRIAEEVLKDLNLASLLYEKANLFNSAIDAASGHFEGHEDRNDAKIRLAELHEKGGNLLSAAKLYESAGRYDKAYVLYESIQHFTRAIECYLKTANPSQDVLIRLYTGTGEFEKVVEIYMKSGTFTDLEKALSVAKTHNLTSHIRVLQDKIAECLSGSEEDLKRCFTKAIDEVLSLYSSVFGIDFGTTNSVAAIFNKKNKKVEVITTSQGSEFEPSFFGVDENNHPIFGEAARLRSLIAPHCVVARVKRSLGAGESFSVGGKKYRSEEVVAKILQRLRLNAEAYLKSKVEAKFYDLLKNSNLRFPEEVLNEFLNKQKGYNHLENVVLSVPAYFNDNQKRATRDSAEIAGLRVRRLLHEPTAAALAYGYQKQYSGKLAVIDLGGGTLDISILDVGEGIYEVQSVGGDTKLGGSDIDAELVRYVIKDIKTTLGLNITKENHQIEIARLRDALEKMKINLSSVNQYTIELPHFLDRPRYTFTMKREELENLSKPVLDRIKETIEKTINNSGLNVTLFLLVGNASKMPAVNKLAEKAIRAKHLRGINPGTVVATGVALQGAALTGDLTDTLLLDVVPYSLGIAVKKEDSKIGELEMSRLIERNTTIPTKKTDTYVTTEDNQTEVRIQIYQGESNVPHQNYFLGDFILGGINPAPAGEKKIEVTFDIDADCILTVTAVDQETRNMQSLTIKDAVTLSPVEKENLKRYFAERENVSVLEERLDKLRRELESLESSFDKAASIAEQAIQDFFELFHEKVEANARLYKVNMEQTKVIQSMIVEKDKFIYGITPKYKDQFASIIKNVKQAEMKHFDFSDKDIGSKLQERINILSNYKEALSNVIESIEKNVTDVVANWVQILRAMEPDMDKMNPLEIANYHLIAGRTDKAKEVLESVASGAEGLTKDVFYLLLKCYIQMGLKEEYRNTHKRFGNLFGIIYPDFNRLNTFLSAIEDSVFMIQGVSQQHGPFSGSGFCIDPNLIVTNSHVIEGTIPSNINIIGKDRTYNADELELDPINDLAILKVSDNLKPFTLGEFNFVEPGEQVFAIGFPSPSSNVHSENIYISKGIVNSIRKSDASSERVIFIDTKIGRGMSGGPLINDLGEVVGIITLVRYQIGQSEKGIAPVEDQPVALPIHLLKKYLMKYGSTKIK